LDKVETNGSPKFDPKMMFENGAEWKRTGILEVG
jgi:hypothetical protein